MSHPASPNRAAILAQRALIIACVISLIAGLLIEHHPHFAFEACPGFFAGFGFLAYCFIVLSAKQLRPWLRREEDHYGDDEELADSPARQPEDQP